MHLKEQIIYDILKQFKPDKLALLKLISSKITDAGLMDIANADYGYKAEENLKALRSIVKKNIIPTNYDLHYAVLGIYRDIYLEVYLEAYPSLDRTMFHVQRSFSCIVLLIATSFSDTNYFSISIEDSSDYNLIQLTESVIYLGKDFQLGLLYFLAWHLSLNNSESLFYDEKVNNIIYFFALIYLVLKTSYIIKEDNLKVLIECLMEKAKDIELYYEKNTRFYKDAQYSKEFLGMFIPKYDGVQGYSKCIQLAKEIPSLITHLKDQDLVNELKNISELIAINEHLYKK